MPTFFSRQLACLIALTVASAITSLTASGAAGESSSPAPNKAGIPPDRTLHFNVSPNGYPPYVIVDGEHYSGIVWDLLVQVAQRLDLQVVPLKIPRKRVNEMLLGGFIDATPRAREWTREPERFAFTDPIVMVEEVFFVPAGASFSFESLDDLKSLTLVTHLGYQYPLLDAHFQSGAINRFDVTADKNLFRYLLDSERFDAVVADRLVGQWIIANEGMRGQFRASRKPISQYQLRLMLRKDWQPFITLFNREMARLKEDGELEKILARYR